MLQLVVSLVTRRVDTCLEPKVIDEVASVAVKS